VPPELRFGKYVIEGLLGPGGVTETYLARVQEKVATKAQSAPLFAVKLLRRDRVPKSAYAEVAARFVSSGKQLRGFHRPGLGKVVEVFEDALACFIASEHVAGRDLNRLVETCRDEARLGIDPILAGLIGAEVARLLHIGHAAKPAFHHLGLSPANVIVTEAGEVVLLDAGIAAAVRAITEQPPERWAFVAPELYGVDAGAPGFDDRRAVAADLFSLGLLLAFLVSGRPPPMDAITGKVDQAGFASTEGISSKQAAAMRTLLASEPEDRPESAAVLVEWLAEGVGSVRERQALIAQGLCFVQMGAAPPEKPAAKTERAPPTVLTPRPRVHVAENGAENSSEEPTLTREKASASTRILILVACAGVLASALVAGLRGWPGRNQETSVRTQIGDMERGRDGKPVSVATAGAESTPTVIGKTAEEGQEQKPAAGESILARAAGHLIAETVPPGAMVWVDEVLVGKTFADIAVGAGGHRIVLIAPGHRMFRDVVDTSQGAILRRTLPAVDAPSRGDGFIDVRCYVPGRYPVLLDDEETGLLYPAKMIPSTAGRHVVGIFVPPERRVLSVEITVETGSKPALTSFNQ